MKRAASRFRSIGRICLATLSLMVGGMVAGHGAARAEDRVVTLSTQGLVGLADLAEAGRATATPIVVLIHDAQGHKDSEAIRRLRQALVERGVSVLAPTLTLGIDRRAGAIDCRLVQGRTLADMVPEVEDWVNYARTTGQRKVFVAGLGLGANLVARYLTVAPTVVGAIFIDPHGKAEDEHAAEDYEKRYGAPVETILAEAESMMATQRPDKGFDVPGFLNCASARITARAFMSFYAPDPKRDTLSLMPQIKTPVLVLATEPGARTNALTRRMADVKAAGETLFQRAVPKSEGSTAPGVIADQIAAFIARRAS
jgi:dienelactone hydrolase